MFTVVFLKWATVPYPDLVESIRQPVGLLVRVEVLTAVAMESSIFWDIQPCSPVKVNRRFGGPYRFHLQV
jgi:hypothetical protein